MRDLLAIRAEAYSEFTYPRPAVGMPSEHENTAFNRAARVYEAEIQHLQTKLAEAERLYKGMLNEGAL